MKTQLLALVAALASSPALASLGTSEQVIQATSFQPAAYTQPVIRTAAKDCGQPQNMMFILRDESGRIVAAAIVQVASPC